MLDILHRLEIDAPRERVYDALTHAEGIRGWWTRDAELDARVGGIGEFRFYQRERLTRVRVDALDAPARVAWTVLDSFMPGWPDTCIRFDLEPAGSGCILAFAHRGFAHENEWFARVTTGWAYFLVSLKRFVECGRGAPSPEVVDFARMLEP